MTLENIFVMIYFIMMWEIYLLNDFLEYDTFFCAVIVGLQCIDSSERIFFAKLVTKL